MSLATQLSSLATRIGTEFKTIRTLISGSGTGDVSALTTTATNLVGAINEVAAEVAASSGIDDGTTTTASTWSSSKIDTEITAAVTTAEGYTDAAISGLGSAASADTTDFDAAGAAATAQTAAEAYADGILAANDAMVYKGVIDCSTNPNYPAANAGDTYKVSVAGKIGGASGVTVEVGDTAICTVDGTAAGTQATVGANWNILQTNINGAVTGPASSTASDFATFSGTSGKVIADSGLSLDTDTSMTADSNTKVPSQAAVVGYVGGATYSQTQIGDPATDFVADFEAALT